MQFLKADTEATVLIGPFLDKTDGVTPETGITLGAADSAELMKHDGTTFVDISALTFTHKAHGMYTLVITSGHLDTEGRLTIFISDESACLPVWKELMVVNANVYDSLFAAATTDYLQVDTLQLGGATQSATDLKDFADAGYDPATNKVQGVVLTDTCTTNTDMVTEPPTAAAVVNEWESQSQSDPTGFHVNVMEVAGTSQTANDNGADINEILADTNELQGDWANDGRLDLLLDACSTHSAADVWDATSASLSLSFESMMDRLYRFLMNKMNITDATGAVALRNDGDSADIASQTITDDDTTTIRTALSWS